MDAENGSQQWSLSRSRKKFEPGVKIQLYAKDYTDKGGYNDSESFDLRG